MGVSVPGMPDAGALSASDWLYILQGTGLDRDRKATLSKVREYCTSAGVTLYELNTSNAVDGVLALALGSATTNAFVVVSGTVRSAHTLNIFGSVPVGCQVNVLMEASGSLKIASGDGATVNGIDATLLLSIGDAALLGRGTGTVWWGSATRSAANTDAAVLAEAQRAGTAESALSQGLSSEVQARSTADLSLSTAISNEATRAEGAEQTLATNLTNEVTARENADTALEQRIDNLPSGAVQTKSVSLGFNDTHVTIPANATTAVLSMTVPAGSWVIDGIVNFQAASGIGMDMPACKVLRAWIGDSASSFNGDNMAIGNTPDTGTSGMSFGSASVPRKAFTFTADTVIYLKAHCSDTPTNGTLSAFGRLTATSVPSFTVLS